MTLKLTRNNFLTTGAEGIACEAGLARADSHVVDDAALCVETADARTGVATVAGETGEVRGAVTADDALRPAAASVRVANVWRDTDAASGHSVWTRALGVLPAR